MAKQVRTGFLALLAAVLCSVVLVAYFRPDLLPLPLFEQLYEKVRQPITSLTGIELPQSQQNNDDSGKNGQNEGDVQAPPPRQLYRIELHSGGQIYSENVTLDGGNVSYMNKGGLAVTINRSEVLRIERLTIRAEGEKEGGRK